MTYQEEELNIYRSGAERPEYLLIQPVDDHDLEVMETEMQQLSKQTDKAFALVTVKVKNWNTDLTPWPAPPVFGKMPFGAGAPETLQSIQDQIIPEMISQYGVLPVILGGYSLAGLFALWGGYETSDFYGIAAASPSVWFPDFNEYARERVMHSKFVYLSLGDKEARTKNKTMATIADAIREQYEICKQDVDDDCVTLEWNPGNHFIDSDKRMARAFAWILNREEITSL